MVQKRVWGVVLAALSICSACGGDDDVAPPSAVPTRYEFESRFTPGASSIDYDGQTARQVLVVDLAGLIGDLSARIDSGTYTPGTAAEVIAALDYYYRFDGASNGEDAFAFTTNPAPTQETWNQLAPNKQLREKFAGNDTVTDHVDWSTGFEGWSDPTIEASGGDIDTPEGLLLACFATIAENALLRANGTDRRSPADPSGAVLDVDVTENGLDLEELVQKLMIGALAFAQGADDYLDSDVADKGVLSPNTRDGDTNHTVLEHAWDEAFGYWGGARDLSEYTDQEASGLGGRADYASGFHDTNGDGRIDLHSEMNFGIAVYAARRDADSAASARTDFSGDALSAFLRGRAIIRDAGETLTASERAALLEQRDRAVRAWEGAIAASAVHYLNEVLQDMGKLDTADYAFGDHAEHWSELKGLSLAFQFNPRSSVTAAQFAELHTLLGDAPVLGTATPGEREAYRAKLLEARVLLGTAFGFADANLGAADGTGGW